ncbi:zf-HC2 domain-containing protein [Metasolibacillus meyeri]|uniref:zf-HC2 domain-containing protein n=1 Tax=Metasolibacillus meyeri TaxID=1071052 RepID=UPI000D2FEE15|nr:zf-HC2 domain-containing protein [Metasolibacillus meyeri]
MNCNIIRDLLPSYVDRVCSDDTCKAVEEHIAVCVGCQSSLALLQQEIPYAQPLPEEVKRAISPFKKINRRHYFNIISAVAITFMVMVIGNMVYQEVGVVNDFFSPNQWGRAVIVSDEDEWEQVSFSLFTDEPQEYVILDSIFSKREVVNGANSDGDIRLRIKDEHGQIIIDDVKIKRGTSMKLKMLERNKKYFFEIQAPPGDYLVNVI